MKKIVGLLAVSMFLACSGCGTFIRGGLKEDFGTQVYPATRYDAGLIEMGITGNIAVGFPENYNFMHFVIACPLVIMAGLLDVPFSLTTDTLLLPWDILHRGEATEPSRK